MAKSQETIGKKEKEKKKAKERQEKLQRKQERKANNKGKSFEDMIAYVDENGNFSSTPIDPQKKRVINVEDIQIGVPKQAPIPETERIRKGVVKFFNDAKGFGFINDSVTQESVFVHINQLSGPLKEKDKVSFEVEMGPKGPSAINVKKEG
ncbi:cold shock domain-containing protein [Paraflavitalea soli]|uniref:Cold shock domain-containing protein n=1 Tax=Paraflavitalea soli TaxID=2315862 RepID=A0A3B7MH74_9BACT|nr:cold shock domain-containing protein [Paraflavitalea soli]